MLKAAEALQRSFEDRAQPDRNEAANIAAEIETVLAQTTISALVLEATSAPFDALGASPTSVSKSLDRYWRNARTVTSHNLLLPPKNRTRPPCLIA
jgi:alkylation response protein AidB-like acyl-CoA dehydrogenase